VYWVNIFFLYSKNDFRNTFITEIVQKFANSHQKSQFKYSDCQASYNYPYRKTMELKNLYECAHFPYLGVQKRGEKKSIKPPSPKGVSIWIP
jgi:hypothetical protein